MCPVAYVVLEERLRIAGEVLSCHVYVVLEILWQSGPFTVVGSLIPFPVADIVFSDLIWRLMEVEMILQDGSRNDGGRLEVSGGDIYMNCATGGLYFWLVWMSGEFVYLGYHNRR